jgi:hypothetical protein
MTALIATKHISFNIKRIENYCIASLSIATGSNPEIFMKWLQTIVPFPGAQSHIFERFERLFMTANTPKDAALFSRTTDDIRQTIFLLTPGAAAFALAIPGHDWFPCDDPRAHRWTLLIGHSDGLETLELSSPN